MLKTGIELRRSPYFANSTLIELLFEMVSADFDRTSCWISRRRPQMLGCHPDSPQKSSTGLSGQLQFSQARRETGAEGLHPPKVSIIVRRETAQLWEKRVDHSPKT